jgi:hypothetical protein
VTMTSFDSPINLSSIELEIEWTLGVNHETSFTLLDVPEIAALVDEHDLPVRSISSGCNDLVLLFKNLAPVHRHRFGAITINGIKVVTAEDQYGNRALVPCITELVAVEVDFFFLDSSSEDYRECHRDRLFRMGNYYWIYTNSENVQRNLVIGHFTDDEKALDYAIDILVDEVSDDPDLWDLDSLI